MAQSTTEKGDCFRDTVGRMLRAGGMEFEAEVRREHVKVDGTLWLQRQPLGSDRRILMETKNYDRPVDQETCAVFAGKYRPDVDAGKYDEAWLVSHGPITPDGRRLIESHRGLRWWTFEKLQRALLSMDGYMTELRRDYEADGVGSYYVEPRLRGGGLLHDRVQAWLATPGSRQLAVVGRYGIGKSTYSRWLAADLAARAIVGDQTARVPVRIPLSDVFDDQSIEGLIGKVLGNRNPPVAGYSFPLFEELNAAGRFVLIFDGFDEMKHGMTAAQFEQNVNRFMSLDRGEAKILILGRDTAFHTEREFKAVIEGRQVTAGGQEIDARGRRPLDTAELDDFKPEGARSFVERYLPVAAARWSAENRSADTSWVAARLAELGSGAFDGLLQRPVHAQMLCDIAARPGPRLDARTQHRLYDHFVHYLVEREVSKKGRFAGFGLNIRRRFNAALAWWLLSNDGASTTTLESIPEKLCWDIGRDVPHNFDAVGLRRELAAGCLIEKGGDRIYFGHRSIQEFLAAEHLSNTNMTQAAGLAITDLRQVLLALTPETAQFLVERLEDQNFPSLASAWLLALEKLVGSGLDPTLLGIFRHAAVRADPAGRRALDKPWSLIIGFFVANQACAFGPLHSRGEEYLARVMDRLPYLPAPAQAAALLLLARVARQAEIPEANFDRARLLAAWLPAVRLVAAAEALGHHRDARHTIQRDEDLLLWAWAKTVATKRLPTGGRLLEVDLTQLERLMEDYLGFGFSRASAPPPSEVPLPAVLARLEDRRLGPDTFAKVREFLQDPASVQRLRPVVVAQSAVAAPRQQNRAPRRPTPQLQDR